MTQFHLLLDIWGSGSSVSRGLAWDVEGSWFTCQSRHNLGSGRTPSEHHWDTLEQCTKHLNVDTAPCKKLGNFLVFEKYQQFHQNQLDWESFIEPISLRNACSLHFGLLQSEEDTVCFAFPCKWGLFWITGRMPQVRNHYLDHFHCQKLLYKTKTFCSQLRKTFIKPSMVWQNQNRHSY